MSDEEGPGVSSTPRGESSDRLPTQPERGEFEENDVPEPGVPFPVPTFNREKWREVARVSLAYGLFLLLAATVLIVVGAVVWGDLDIATAEDLFQTLLAPLIGLVGAATGFYFAGKDR